METSHRHSTVSILLFAFFALTFISHGVSSLAQTKSRAYGEKTAFIISKIDEPAVTAFQHAWHLSGNGFDRLEALVLLYRMGDGSILARSLGRGGRPGQFTFGWTANIVAVVHTHPNGYDPKPAGDDVQLADRFRIPVFTITQRGMYVYDPNTRKTSMVQDGLDWLESAKWIHDRPVVAQRP